MMEKKKRTILAVLLALAFLVSSGMVIRQQILYRKIDEDSAEAAQIAGLPKKSETPQPAVPAPSDPIVIPKSEEPVVTQEPEEQAEPLPEEVAALLEIDLNALREINSDVAGWIEIPGTELSYPLMQGTDNQYYLSHNWKGEASGSSVFLEMTSDRDLTAFHTIAYGHRMQNGGLFGMLKYYDDPDYWSEHPSVYLVIDDGVYRYDIFSAHEASVKGIVYRLDLEESSLENEFLQYCVDDSVIDTGIVPEADDRILTLSTCTGNGHANRWVIHGVLTQTYPISTSFPRKANPYF